VFSTPNGAYNTIIPGTLVAGLYVSTPVAPGNLLRNLRRTDILSANMGKVIRDNGHANIRSANGSSIHIHQRTAIIEIIMSFKLNETQFHVHTPIVTNDSAEAGEPHRTLAGIGRSIKR
jgi:hypothetical protein